MFPLNYIPVNIRPFFIHPIGTVRGIGGDIKKKGLSLFSSTKRIDSSKRTSVQSGESFLCGFAVLVAFVGVVKIIIPVMVRCLPYPPTFMPHHILKTLILRTAGSIIPGATSPSSPCGSRLCKVLSNGDFIVVQITPPACCPISTGAGGVSSSH